MSNHLSKNPTEHHDTPESLYATHAKLAAERDSFADILDPVLEAHARLGKIATLSISERWHHRKERKELSAVVHNYNQAIAADNGDFRDFEAQLAHRAQQAYDEHIERAKQHLAEHPEQYPLPGEEAEITQ